MKKTLVFLVMLFGMISITALHAQKLDATIDNGISNIGMGNEFNFRTFSLDVCPLRINGGSSFLGVYGETNELYSKNEDQSWTSRSVAWHTGISFNTKFGAGEDDGGWFLKTRLGFGQATTRTKELAKAYDGWQRDANLNFSLKIGIFDPMATWFSRHMLAVDYRQPLSSYKNLYYSDRITSIGDSLTWNNQVFKATFTETMANFFISSNDDWLMNVDLAVGFGMEHPQVVNLSDNAKFFTVGAGISFFKLPYFQQNILEITPEMQFLSTPRFMLKFKINLVPIIFLIWDKETFDFKLSEVSRPSPSLLPTENRLGFNQEIFNLKV